MMIQGDWDDLVNRHDLHGRKVRVIILDEEPGSPEVPGDNPWLTGLHVWADSHKSPGHLIDDGRENIYSGTVDDPR